MIIVLKNDITPDQKSHIRSLLFKGGCVVREMNATEQNVIGALGKTGMDADTIKNLPGVEDVIDIPTAFKLVSRQWHPEDTIVQVGPVAVGGERIVVIAGPCAIESLEQALTIAREVKRYGAVLFRGGAFKPRTSPYSFQGLEEEGLKILAQVRDETGLGVVTEITSPAYADMMMKYVDVVQIGARNMQNFELLKCVGRMGKPVILKRGLASTMEEWLMSAEYILSEGNDKVILCERGIRTFEPYTRNTLDLSAIPVLKKLTHLPVVVDPSHATGMREKVLPMSRSAIAAGADGLMVEVHHKPEEALSDGPQSLYPKQFGQLTRDIYVIAPVVDKQMDFDYLAKAKATDRQDKSGLTQSETIAYLGEPGTFSHKATLQYFGADGVANPQPSFKDIFDAVHTGKSHYGVVPLENSLTGSIHENYDLLLDYDLKIVGEITIRIKHHLLGKPGATLDSIKRVLSQPQVLQQCRRFLEQHPSWELVSVNATTAAVIEINQSDDMSSAAIGSKDAAEIYGMAVIEEGIETNPRNFTRFVVIAQEPISDGAKRKSSVVFSSGNQPGALFEIMKVFSENKLNLVKLESRPIHGKPWEYMFYADVEADMLSDELQTVWKELQRKTEFIRLLGAY